MLSGRRLDLLDPSPLDIEIADIAHGLARVARWNGQTAGDHAFSVAEHSVLVLSLFDQLYPGAGEAERLTALLHDAPEYVIGDIISPFKAVLGDGYRGIEKRLLGAVHLRFGLAPACPPRLHARIKRADRVAAALEAVRLAGFSDAEARRFFGPVPAGLAPFAERIGPLPAGRAAANFLAAFEALRG